MNQGVERRLLKEKSSKHSVMTRVKAIFLLKLVLCVLLTAYVAVCSYLFINQRNIIYLPTKEQVSKPITYGLAGVEDVTLQTPDNIRLEAWYHKPVKDEKTVIYFPGNNGNIRFRVNKIQAFMDKGFGVLALSYRGYGNSNGKPSEGGLYTDARTAIRFLKQYENIEPYNLILYGESLGSGVAVQMATEYRVGALILESPYTSLDAIAHYRYPYIPTKILLRDKFDSLSKIDMISAPLLIIHGYLDTTIPIKHSKMLLAKARSEKEGYFLPQFNHSNIDYELIANRLYQFSQRVGSSNMALLKSANK